MGSSSLGPIVSADWAYVVKQFGLDCFSSVSCMDFFFESEYSENYV